MTTEAPTQARSATVSVTTQLGAKGVHLVLNVVSTLAIIRYLAPDSYGTYVLVLTITAFAGVIADFGLPKLAVREMVRKGEDPDTVAGTIIWMRLALALAAVVLVQAAVAAFGQPPEAHLAAAVASMVIVVEAVLGIIVVVFHVHVVQQYEALVRTLGEGIETALILVFVAIGVTLPWLFVPPLVGVLVAVVVAARIARRRYRLHPRLDRAMVRPLWVEALPLGPALLVAVLYLKLDSFVVAAMRPPEDLGLYGAAYQPIEYLFLASAVVINVLFPLLAKAWAAGETPVYTRLYRRGTELVVIAMLFVPVVTVFVAPQLVALAFGPEYAGSADPLRILSVALVLLTVNGWQSLVLLAGGHQRAVLRYNLAALALSLVLCIAFVEWFGIVGAAASTLLTAVFVLVVSTLAVRRLMSTRLDAGSLASIVAVAALPAAVMAASVSLDVSWIAATVVAGLAYAGALWRLGFHRRIQEAIA